MTLVYYLIDPLTWFSGGFVLLLWLCGTGRRKPAQWVGVVMIGFIFTFMISPILVFLVKSKERMFSPWSAASMDGDSSFHIMVLGAGKVSEPGLPPSTQLGGTVLARLVEGIRIYRKMPGARLISSASAGDSKITQAKTVADAAVDLGVSSLDTLQLPGGYNTESEAMAYADRFGTETPLILVTSAVHMERAVFWFEYYGVEVIPAPCDYRIKEDPDDPEIWWRPSFGRLDLFRIWIHEKLGMWYALWLKD